MNEADPAPINLDELRMLPDWLREDAPPPSKQYAAHNYPVGDETRDRRGGGRSGGFGGSDRRDARGGGPPDRRRDGGGRSGPPTRGGGGNRGPQDDRRFAPPTPAAPVAPAPVRVEFLPDDRCLASINKQIRATHLAYPLFGLARMFLQEPERHYVQFSLLTDAPAGTSLYQLGDEGVVSLDRAILEKAAFENSKEQFYVEQSVQKEPLKGNFNNVARERLSGTLLGPTNYHAYQPALRSLYESRYSRRMSFEEFRRNVEVSTDPALIERWKEEARTTTTINTRVGEGETPVVLPSEADARAHFRQHHLDALLHAGAVFKVHGSVARKLPEPRMMQVLRESHEREMRYPAQFVQLLRQGLQNSGLHIFKHRKRVVYVSLARPTPFVARGAVSPSLTAILEAVAQSPLCTRKALAERVLSKDLPRPEVAPEKAVVTPPATKETASDATAAGTSSAEEPETPVETALPEAPVEPTEVISVAAAQAPAPAAPPVVAPPEDPAARAKAALAADLRFLVQSGHIIEFHNGTFDLPLPPKPKENPPASAAKSATGKPEVARTATTGTPPPSPLGEPPEAATTAFTASGAGVAESLESTDESAEDPAPSLLEAIEPAPTSANLSEDAPATDARAETVADMVIEPGPAVPGDVGEHLHDKTDDDGRISGPEAAPLDPPIPGDA